MNGLWIAHFSAGAAHGNGIAVLRAGELLGGDFSHTWTGTYEEEGSQLYARVRVAPHPPDDPEFAEREKPTMLTLSGTCSEHTAILTGHSDENDVPVSIELRRAE